METLLDYHKNELVSNIYNIDSLLNIILNDFTCEIDDKYNNFDTVIDSLLKKDSIILDNFNTFIKNSDTQIISYSNLIKIIDDVNNSSNNQNNTFKVCFLLWIYIHY